ncbi:MAG: hypothetical protein AVDCRST_MAG65-2452, partial [uncultured Solirubrobacteraceae bacterium]
GPPHASAPRARHLHAAPARLGRPSAVLRRRAAAVAHRGQARAGGRQEAARARARRRRRALEPAHQSPAGRHRHPPGPPDPHPGRSRRQAGGARPHPDRAAPGAPAPRPPARTAGRGPRGARRPARRALQGRRARLRDRPAGSRRLHRPARADRVHAPRLRPGPPHHRVRPAQQARGDRDGQAARPPRGAPGAGHRHRRRPSRPGRRPQVEVGRAPRELRVGAHGEVDHAGVHARAPPSARGRPQGARGGVRAGRRAPGLRAGGLGRRLGFPRAGGSCAPRLERSDLAGQRTAHLAVRDAVGTAACRRRHLGPDRHADPGRRERPGRPARLDGRLRQLHLRAAQRGAVDVLRAPGPLRDVDGSVGQPGPGHRLRRQHRQLLRRAPALRDPHQRHAGQPGRLPL